MTYQAPCSPHASLNEWRILARRAISHRIPPSDLNWSDTKDLFSVNLPSEDGPYQMRVSAEFLKLAGSVIWHSEPYRFAFLYAALWRIDQSSHSTLSPTDSLGRELNLMAKSVGRDIHKMHAFVRFRELPSEGERRRFAAWFEPEHFTLEPGSSFFVKRFADMDWTILTPYLSARFEAGQLTFGNGCARPDLPDDASEALWGTYFANIFNPARIKLNAMRAEMPKKYWRNMPETKLIPSMLADAEARVQRMYEAGVTQPRKGAAAVSTRYRATLARPENKG